MIVGRAESRIKEQTPCGVILKILVDLAHMDNNIDHNESFNNHF